MLSADQHAYPAKVISCADCGHTLRPDEGGPRPACQSINRNLRSTDTGSIHERSLLQHLRADTRAVSLERIDGAELSADGTYAEVHKVHDFDGHQYAERVVLADGTVARDVQHDLREHTGRGSDKPELRVPREAEKQAMAEERAARKRLIDLAWRSRKEHK